MTMTGLFPVLLSRDVPGAQQFYERHFGLVPRFVSDWYVHLAHPWRPIELALMTPEHESLPRDARTPAAGVLLSFEVPEAAVAYAHVVNLGAELVHGLRDEAWGQRHFLLRGPDGVLVDVIERIAPSDEYASAYAAAP